MDRNNVAHLTDVLESSPLSSRNETAGAAFGFPKTTSKNLSQRDLNLSLGHDNFFKSQQVINQSHYDTENASFLAQRPYSTTTHASRVGVNHHHASLSRDKLHSTDLFTASVNSSDSLQLAHSSPLITEGHMASPLVPPVTFKSLALASNSFQRHQIHAEGILENKNC